MVTLGCALVWPSKRLVCGAATNSSRLVHISRYRVPAYAVASVWDTTVQHAIGCKCICWIGGRLRSRHSRWELCGLICWSISRSWGGRGGGGGGQEGRFLGRKRCGRVCGVRRQ